MRHGLATVAVVALLPVVGVLCSSVVPAQKEGGNFYFEVFVTDKKGNPITDLAIDDFEVSEDGKSVGITEFVAISEGVSGDGESAARSTRIIVYIDVLHLNQAGLKNSTQRLKPVLADLANGGYEVMIVVGSDSVDVFENFTSDRSEIERAIDRLEQMDVKTDPAFEKSILACVLEQGNCAIDRSVLLGELIPQYVLEAEQRAIGTLQALERLVVDLAATGGRKSVLYVSDGLPLRPGDEIYQALDGIPGPSRANDLSEEADLLVKSANANRVSFYTLSSGGPGISIVGASASNQFGASNKAEIYRNAWKTNMQSGLETLSGKTGGWTAFNAKSFAETAANDCRFFYRLGYPPDHEAGRYHKLEVKVRRKKVKVRYRSGYYDDPVVEPRIH